jgi:hypothetical protein
MENPIKNMKNEKRNKNILSHFFFFLPNKQASKKNFFNYIIIRSTTPMGPE